MKKWLLDHSHFDIVITSKWMAELVSSSPLVSHFPIHIIPFGIYIKRCGEFDDNNFRKRYSIPREAVVIAFRHRGKDDKCKGWPFIEEAVLKIHLNSPVYLVFFDKTGGLKKLKKRYQVVELRWISNRESLFEAIAAADLFLMPSVAEAFGMMAIEAMACGTPIIVFEGTALPEVMHSPHGGIAVPRDANALACAIEKVLNDHDLYERLIENGRRIVREEYSSEKYIQRHIDLYRKLICKK
ncbi:MAG TPA: glycosyltransferase [Atribacter sp.]|uniref:glycosyltransferase n=1 Tax=Atribacter sp. TaxID=2847780 RepID=UPI0005B277C4|nr:glycosyltransferase [Atribacter sp.]HQK83276.1 glycosyltransferase [Atribacter sp.]